VTGVKWRSSDGIPLQWSPNILYSIFSVTLKHTRVIIITYRPTATCLQGSLTKRVQNLQPFSRSESVDHSELAYTYTHTYVSVMSY